MAGGSTTTTTIVPTSTTTAAPTSTTSTTTKLIGPAGQMKLQIQEYGKTREITVFNPGQNIISLETLSGSTDAFISIRERAPVMISFPSRNELDAFASALNSSIINGVTPFTLSNIRTGALLTTTAAPTTPTSTSTTSTTTVAGSTTTTTTIISPSIQWNFTKAEGTSATFKLYKSTDGGANFTVVETRYSTDSGTYYSIANTNQFKVQVITTADRNGVAEIRNGATVLATSSGLGSQITTAVTAANATVYTAVATAGL
jgi:hypothetical protein